MVRTEKLSEVAAECHDKFLYPPFAATHTHEREGRLVLSACNLLHLGRSEKIQEGSFDFFSPNHRVRDTESVKNRATGAMTTPAMKISGLGWIWSRGKHGEKRDLHYRWQRG